MFYGICFSLILVLLYFLSWFWPPDSPWSLWWKTKKDVALAAAKLANIKKGDVVYELGSGDGEFLLAIAKQYHCQCVGIEIDPLRYWFSKIRVKLAGLDKIITVRQKNFFDTNFFNATVVYTYLVPNALERLVPKLKKELKPGTRVVSYRYQAPLKEIGTNTKHKLYLYKI